MLAFEPDAKVARDQGAPPPISLDYTLKGKGNVAIAIDDAEGKRIRNLIADVTREPGAHNEIWDGRDDDGKPVKPGRYQFRGAVLPKPSLIYEFTVNNSGSPPWWKQDVWEPRPYPGGWMSDHAPPLSAAAVGDKVFLGADAAEHGHSIIAVDLTGKKLWGAKWLELAGSRCICTDGKTVYAAGEGSWIGQHMKLFAIDPQNFSVRKITDLDFTAGPLSGMGGLAGMAARDGKVYASFNPPHQDLAAPAFDVNAIDFEQTTMPGLQAKHVAALLRIAESDQPWVNLPLDPEKPAAIRIAWKSEQVIGAIVSPHRLEVAALRPDAAYPGSLEKDDDWVPFKEDRTRSSLNAYLAPGETHTRALRMKVLSAVPPINLSEPLRDAGEAAAPVNAFVGLRAFKLRLQSVQSPTRPTANAGQLLQAGAWEDRQETDITAEAPAIYTLSFEKPAFVSAVALRDPFFTRARIEIKSDGSSPWISAGVVQPTFPWRRAYTDSVVDLGRSRLISAIRIVITEPAVDQNADVKKRTGLSRRTCSVGGVLLLDSSGAPEPGQRISVLNAESGQIERELPIASPGPLAFDSEGHLLAISGSSVVSVPLDGSKPSPLFASGFSDPTGLTCDAKTIYVADSGDNVVRKFSTDGKPAGQIGKPGGIEAGEYDPQHMSRPHGICIDANGKLWVAEEEMRPKKVSVWDVSGRQPKLERYFIGGSRYGSGFMFIDPKDPSRFFFEGMEFAVNWKSGKSVVKNITWRAGRGFAWDGVTCDRPIYLKDRLYLVGEPFWFYGNRYFAVAKYVEGKAVPVAAAGKAEEWPPLKDGRIAAKLGTPKLDQFSFLWSDRNDNGLVDPDEVRLSEKDVRLEAAYFGAWAGEDLTLQFTSAKFKPTGFTKGGAPLYDFDHMTPMPKLTPGGFGLYNTAMTSTGDFIEISDRVAIHGGVKGNLKWSYPDRFNGVHGSMKAPPPRPGMLIGTLHVIGRATLPELGEVFAVMTNKGEVLIFTTDGLFVSRLFEDNRYGKSFNLPTADRGMSLDNISLNAEHFGGTFNQLSDGRIVIVAGHNHNSVIRVNGLGRGQRFDGTVQVSEAQARVASLPPEDVVPENKKPEPIVVTRSAGGSKIDGILDEWKDVKPVELKGTGEHKGRVWLAYDPGALLVAAEVSGTKGMVNHEKDWKLLFRSGDGFDLQLRTAADQAGGDPVAGDLRLLISMYNGEATAVVYRPVVPNTPAKNKSTFASPVASVSFDVVEKLDLPITVNESKTGYTLEAAIPWATLGVKPAAGLRLSGDVGLLFADQAGLATVERIYWSNRNSGLVSDVPGEARLEPKGWGTLELQK